MRVNSLESDYYRASFMKNLLKDDCSESEGSGSEGNSGTCNEGGGTSEGLSSASGSRLLRISSHHTGPGGGFLGGEAGKGGVNLGANLLGLEPGSGGSGGKNKGVRGGKASSGGNTVSGCGQNSRAVVGSHNHVPFGGSDGGGGSDSSAGAEVLGGSVVGDHGRVLKCANSSASGFGSDGLSVEADDGVGSSDSEASTNVFATGTSNVGGVATHLDVDLVTIRVGLDGSSNLDDGVSGPGGGGGTGEGDVKNFRATGSSGSSTHRNGHLNVERKRKIIL